ncbi:MAG: hypothetical protein WC383_12905 [Gammaproteobacteria bacterium]
MRKALLVLPALLLPALVYGNDYPTEARVQYVFECMADHGGQSYGNLYKCSCAIDRIAAAMPYEKFVEADTYTRGRGVMGERGGEFRDPPRGKKMREELAQVEKQAKLSCFPGEVTAR